MSKDKIDLIMDTTGYASYVEKVRQLMDLELSNVSLKIPDIALSEKIRYVVRTHGKRLRPLLVMLSTQSLGGDIEAIRKLALAIELLHTATLVHDDILDEDVFRRNALTVSAKWGIREAVLVGDALASLSMHTVADYDDDIVKIMSRTCLLLSDGEYLDVENATKRQSENDYLDMIRKKSASLFEAAAECGAIAAKGSLIEIRSLKSFGENFGMAYQIRDDLSDLQPSGHALPQDIDEFRTTLPIIHLSHSSTATVRDQIMKNIESMKTQNCHQKAVLFERLHKSLVKTGSLQYCLRKIDQYLESAIASLYVLDESIYKDYLVRMCESLRANP